MNTALPHDKAFGEYERSILRTLAALMIPSVDDVPGAADETIFAVALVRLEPSALLVQRAVTALDAEARKAWGSDFMALDEDRQLATCELHLDSEFRSEFQLQVVTSYYEDNRVRVAIGMRPGPAFPEGYDMEETDWGLLDPVRSRKPFYREVTVKN